MKRPSLPRMLLRGLFRRCAWCGGRGAFFTGWTSKQSTCRTCGLNWRRGDVGYELGAAATAAIISVGPLVLLLGAVLAVTWPDVHVVPMLIVLGVGAVVMPILLYPSSYTTWQAVDILLRPPEPDDFESVGEASASNAS
ncbi:DUF983 domain-containing protein [Ilumatobacter nonamiensis]|uniref:DUF983 domain-containing protein n=1 Tax=Ilumatobacter nonamiensis TaxID=467093 RepID=UPI00034B2315|nr:DUF983 domain-containing protein [Ilumatobacter nonamiensis]